MVFSGSRDEASSGAVGWPVTTRFPKLTAAVLAAATVLVPAGSIGAQSIGVTSASIGDPLGKPPSAAERMLRVGIDLQAGELVTTGAEDRCHLLFLDGTALTVGPQARLTLDKFVYDSDRKLGALNLSATRGTFRLVGGRISKKVPITVATPSGTLTIRGGIMLFRVEPAETTATMLFGYEMTVTSLGQTRSVTAPGWQVTSVAGRLPSAPIQTPRGGLLEDMRRLEGLGRQPGDGTVDRAARSSGFTDRNSGLGPEARGPVQGGPPPRSFDRFGPPGSAPMPGSMAVPSAPPAGLP
jgi:FecR protein